MKTSTQMTQILLRTLKSVNSSTFAGHSSARSGKATSGPYHQVQRSYTADWLPHSKSFYLQQVHQPRHLAESARLFGPAYLECFTKTAWYVVPTFWLPIVAYLFVRSAMQFDAPRPAFSFSHPASNIPSLDAVMNVSSRAWSLTFACFLVGNLIWTLLEYGFHRLLFHVDRLLPDTPAFLTIHFLIHGVHHYLPMDRCVPFPTCRRSA
jgi:hypothetical protein